MSLASGNVRAQNNTPFAARRPALALPGMTPAEAAPPHAVAQAVARTLAPAIALVAAPLGWTALCLGLAALVGGIILVAPYPPLQDFPEWAYQGHLLARLIRGLPIGEIGLAEAPVPNTSVQLLLGLLSLAMPATAAARLFLLSLVGTSAALALALGRRYQPGARGAFAALLLVAVFLNAAFWNGYANFQLGMLLLGAWFLLPEARRGQAGPIMGFGLALFFTHAMAFFALCVLLGLAALPDRRRIMATALGLAPAVALTGWYVAADAGGGATEITASDGLASFVAYKLYTIAKLGPYHNFVFATGGDIVTRPAAYRAGVAINTGFALGLVAALLLGLRTAIRTRRLASAPLSAAPMTSVPLPWAPLLAAAVLLGLFAVLPDMVQNVVNPGERLLLPALLMLLLVLPLPVGLVRALGLGALVLGASLLPLLATGPGRQGPVHFTELRTETAGLFRHRPTAFACKWQEMLRNAAAGDTPREKLAFRTSLLVGATAAGCTGRPG